MPTVAEVQKALDGHIDETGQWATEVEGQLGKLHQQVFELQEDTAPRNSIHVLLPRVMEAVGVVGKDHRNPQHDYTFRSIDDIVDKVAPALQAHGVSISSQVVAYTSDQYTTGRGTVMLRAVVHMRYRFYGPQGDYVQVDGVGEAADASDKAHMKAMQQAYKYALVQGLAIPTGEPDADAASPEGVAAAKPDDFTNWTKAKILDLVGGDTDVAKQLWEQLAAGVDKPLPEDEALAIYAAAKAAREAPFEDGDTTTTDRGGHQ